MSDIMTNGAFLTEYKKDMIKALKRINPDWKKKEIEEVLDDMMKERIQNPKVTADNNYTKEERETTLLSVLDWYIEREPIIAGNFTFYKKQEELLNPVAKMLDNKLQERKQLKKEMFRANELGDMRLYRYKDRMQGNVKKTVNSYYGGSGAPTSAFYSEWSGPSTTCSAQEAISTAEQMFEGLVANNYFFINLSELMDWCNAIFKDFKDDDYDEDVIIVGPDTTIERLYDRILNHEDNDEEILSNFVYSLSEKECTYVYYKNNLIEFIDRNDSIKDLIYDVFDKIENLDYVEEKDDWFKEVPSKYKKDFQGKGPKDYNKFVNSMYFMDPNSPPENITELLKEINYYCNKYVFCNYLSFDRIYRLKNFKRWTVTVIDTDSNILSLDTIINYILDNIVGNNSFGRKFENNEYIAVNLITYILTDAVKKVLYTYSEYANMSEGYKERIAMKN